MKRVAKLVTVILLMVLLAIIVVAACAPIVVEVGQEVGDVVREFVAIGVGADFLFGEVAHFLTSIFYQFSQWYLDFGSVLWIIFRVFLVAHSTAFVNSASKYGCIARPPLRPENAGC